MCNFKEAVRGLTARNNFVKQEEHVTAIKRWDGEDVHKGKHEGDKCGEFPETLPIPCRGEECCDGAKRTDALGAFLGEDVFEVAYITCEYVPPVSDTCGDALQ